MEEVWLSREGRWVGRLVVVCLQQACGVDFGIVFALTSEAVCVCVFELEGCLCVVRLSDCEDDPGAWMEVRLLSGLATSTIVLETCMTYTNLFVIYACPCSYSALRAVFLSPHLCLHL